MPLIAGCPKNRCHESTARWTGIRAAASVLCLLFSAVGCGGGKPAGKSDPTAVPSAGTAAKSAAPEIVFLSTQFNVVEEAGKIRNTVLKGFRGTVDFRPVDSGALADQLAVERKANPGKSLLIGALHGDLAALLKADLIRSLDDVLPRLRGRSFVPSLLAMGRLGGDAQSYVPWVQASYVMVASRKALPYLPAGAKLDTLTYRQLSEWGKAMRDAAGSAKIGFPAGEKGLLHRFLQGYLYPAYTGNTLVRFKAESAVPMWEDLRKLWEVVNRNSLLYSSMSQPLATGEVWVAWDHTARLLEALEKNPGDYAVFPAPSGPSGRGYMSVLAGLAVSRDSPLDGGVVELIEYLTRPAVQETVLAETGFIPVVGIPPAPGAKGAREALGGAVAAQAGSPGAVATLLPIGLGSRNADFNALYMLAFTQIVLNGADVRATLAEIGGRLEKILEETGAASWPPDAPAEKARLE